jgi:hypothetical protein
MFSDFGGNFCIAKLICISIKKSYLFISASTDIYQYFSASPSIYFLKIKVTTFTCIRKII